jgi:hypothetical protein
MKLMKHITVTVLAISMLTGPLAALAADQGKSAKPKPYTLKTCVVSGDELGGMGAPYVFVHEGQEIKLCCKGCLKDFKKNAAKYVKKIEEAEAKAKKSKG